MEEKRHLLPVTWSYASESRTQRPRKDGWDGKTNELSVYAIEAVEPEFWLFKHHLRKSS